MSTHAVRKAGTNDSAFNHQVHDLLDDTKSEDDDDDVPETKNQYFEFSNGYHIMRVIKLIFIIQVIGLVLDNPSIKLAILFDTFCRGISLYSLKFQSRPFLDIIYLIQYFLDRLRKFLVSQEIPVSPSSIEIIARRLNVNPYLDEDEKPTTPPAAWSVDTLNDRYFHAMKFYAQYILVIFFVVLAVLLLLRFWEIHDYSNREEVKVWLNQYIADGWWRKGGLNVFVSIARASVGLLLTLLTFYAIANGFGPGTFPDSLYMSSLAFVGIIIIAVIWLFGYAFIRITEASFVRYVSQNVAYTSAIILKRAVKAKIDLGLLLLSSLFVPFLYTMLQAMLFFTDWNRTLVPSIREDIYYFRPCYYMAFPPYKRDQIDRNTCSSQPYAHNDMPPGESGNFYVRNILSCDSYWGIVLYAVSASCFTVGLVAYAYFFKSFVHQASEELRNSRWVEILDKLVRIRDEETFDYEKRFSLFDRLWIQSEIEIAYQLKSVRVAFVWIFKTTIAVVRGLFLCIYRPLHAIMSPVLFLLDRLVVVPLFDYTDSAWHELRQMSMPSIANIRRTNTKDANDTRVRNEDDHDNSNWQQGNGSQQELESSDTGSVQGGGDGEFNSARTQQKKKSKTKKKKRGSLQLGGNKSRQKSIRQAQLQATRARRSSFQRSNTQQSHNNDSSSNSSLHLIGFEKDFTSNHPTSAADNDLSLWTLNGHYESRLLQELNARFNVLRMLLDYLGFVYAWCVKKVLSLQWVVYLRVQMGLLWQRCGERKEEESFDEMFNKQQQQQSTRRGYSVTAVGGVHAPWRQEITLQAKTRLVHRMQVHVLHELKLAKDYFVSDHELVLSVLDYTVDSAGLATLLMPFRYERLWWFLVVLCEMFCYAVFAPVLKVYASWTARNYVLFALNVLFGLVTYIGCPYTEEIDRWLDFSGRCLLSFVMLGLPIYESLAAGVIAAHKTYIYAPWRSFAYLQDVFSASSASLSSSSEQFALVVDIMLVLFFYTYLLCILESIGLFRTLERMLNALVYAYHDHILDFLVEKMDERTFGLENIFSGMIFLQQWDDIIRLQRRYALLIWPDVRPQTLITTWAKLLEVKWAALFNLTLNNVRSSLGLTLLHVAMSSADSEVARWLIHTNPALLMVSDSQNDNPITIALKECAYHLLVYGEQNAGYLDDGTSYADEAFGTYYPEIDDLRDEIFLAGEFIAEQCVTVYLTAQDVETMQKDGVYRESVFNMDTGSYETVTSGNTAANNMMLMNTTAMNNTMSNSMNNSSSMVMNTTSNNNNNNTPVATKATNYSLLDPMAMEEEITLLQRAILKPKAPAELAKRLDDLQRMVKMARKKEKMRNKRMAQEKASLVAKRFPEDDFLDDFESGDIAAWDVMDFVVPNENIYLDAKIMKQIARDPSYHYHMVQQTNVTNQQDKGRSILSLFGLSNSNPNNSNDNNNADDDLEGGLHNNSHNNSRNNNSFANHYFSDLSGISSGHLGSRHLPADLQYVIPSLKKVHYVEESLVVPLTSHNAGLLKQYPDWDKRRKHGSGGASTGLRNRMLQRRGSNASLVSSSQRSSNTHNNHDMQSNHSGSTRGLGLLKAALNIGASDAKQVIDTKWKVCRFAEILMSTEISAACRDLRWSVLDFKLFTKVASVNQGKIAQQLAMACHLHPPPGFVRVSDWSVAVEGDMFDEKPEEDLPMLVKGIVNLVSTVELVATSTLKAVDRVVETATMDTRRGRERRRRSSVHSMSMQSKSQRAKLQQQQSSSNNNGANTDFSEGMLSDRVIQFLAEAMVCSTEELILEDAELSYNGRRGWRALCRALRKKHCTFVIPSLLVPPKKIHITRLQLARNELDCGDCVLLADVLLHQRSLQWVDLSFNCIGARGVTRLCKALRDHECLTVFNLEHNIIGPGAGKDIGLLLKNNRSITSFNLSYNHLGEIIRFPTMYTREKLPTAAHDLVLGLRSNKTLQSLDLSYNHLGPSLADNLHWAVNRHPCLHTLVLSGNDLGPEAGTKLIFLLAGQPKGPLYARERETFMQALRDTQKQQVEQLRKDKANFGKDLDALAAENDADIMGSIYFSEEAREKHLKAARLEAEAWLTSTSMWEADAEDDLEEEAEERRLKEERDALNISRSPTNFQQQSSVLSNNNNNSITLSPPKSPSSASKKYLPPSSSNKVSQAMRGFSNALDHALQNTNGNNNINEVDYPAQNLTALSLADNQLGAFAGHAIAAALDRMKGLTYLDLSGNALGPLGGERIADQLELLYLIKPRDFFKLVLWEIEESKYTGRNPKKRKKIFTNLVHLNLNRNSLGPKVLASLALCLQQPNCGIIKLDVADNPIGSSAVDIAGNAAEMALVMRQSLRETTCLLELNLTRSQLLSTDLVTIFGGLSHNLTLQKLQLADVTFDEPACLQLGNVLEHCLTLQSLDVARCKMGANGGLIVAQKLRALAHKLHYLDLTGNYIGPVAALYIAEAIKDDHCRFRTLRLGENVLMEEGGCSIAKAMVFNSTITDLDLSSNQFNAQVASFIAEFAKGLFRNGVQVRASSLQRLLINDNPDIGYKGARSIVRSVTNELIAHFEMRNIGAGPAAANLISQALRDPKIAWTYLDIRQNKCSRIGLNQMFWALRSNKRLRVLKVGENEAGTMFCSDGDALLSHGIAVPVCLRTNVVLREVDLSFNSLTSEAGVNILDAIIDNHTIKKLSLRGNLLDDEVASMLPDLFKCNNVLEELDLGQNRMAFSCAFAIAEGLEVNRALKVLLLDYNRFGGAGSATLDLFCRSIMMNYSLQVLNLDGNKLGPEWGMQLGQTFARNNTLVQVSLRDNRLDTRAGQALLNVYRHAPYLLELALTADEIGEVLWEEFRRVFVEKRACVDPGVLREETRLSQSQSHLLASYQVNAPR